MSVFAKYFKNSFWNFKKSSPSFRADKSKNPDWIWVICTEKMFRHIFPLSKNEADGKAAISNHNARSISENLIRQSLILNKSFDLFWFGWSLWPGPVIACIHPEPQTNSTQSLSIEKTSFEDKFKTICTTLKCQLNI